MFNHIQSCSIISNHVQSYSIIFNHVQSYSIMFNHIQSCSIIFNHVQSYSIMFNHIQSYSIIFNHIQSYSVFNGINIHPGYPFGFSLLEFSCSSNSSDKLQQAWARPLHGPASPPEWLAHCVASLAPKGGVDSPKPKYQIIHLCEGQTVPVHSHIAGP
jgi:hypothetical protein